MLHVWPPISSSNNPRNIRSARISQLRNQKSRSRAEPCNADQLLPPARRIKMFHSAERQARGKLALRVPKAHLPSHRSQGSQRQKKKLRARKRGTIEGIEKSFSKTSSLSLFLFSPLSGQYIPLCAPGIRFPNATRAERGKGSLQLRESELGSCNHA